MKTLNTLISAAAIAACCSTTAFAEPNSARLAVFAPERCEELVITAQRTTSNTAVVLGTAERSALLDGIKLEARKDLRQSLEQFMTEQAASAAKTVLQSTKSEALQASL